jgi:hypothetical protein
MTTDGEFVSMWKQAVVVYPGKWRISVRPAGNPAECRSRGSPVNHPCRLVNIVTKVKHGQKPRCNSIKETVAVIKTLTGLTVKKVYYGFV